MTEKEETPRPDQDRGAKSETERDNPERYENSMTHENENVKPSEQKSRKEKKSKKREDEFAPLNSSDLKVAEAASIRLYPQLRRLPDGTWLERGEDRWIENKNDNEAAFRALASLTDKVPSREGFETLRTKMSKNSGLNAVTSIMSKHATSPNMPLYADPEALYAPEGMLFAAGQRYNLHTGQPFSKPFDGPHLDSAGTRAPNFISNEDPLTDYLQWTLPDPDVRLYFCLLLGAALSGTAPKILPHLHGPKNTAKTSLMNLVLAAVGTYGEVTKADTVLGKSNQHATFLVEWQGRRILFIEEAPQGFRADMNKLKEATGGTSFVANRMRQDPIMIHPTWALFMASNDALIITDPAVRERARIFPWGRSGFGEDEDPTYPALVEKETGKLRIDKWGSPKSKFSRAYAALPAVLGALMEYSQEFLRDPGAISHERAPERVKSEMLQIEGEQDQMAQWFAAYTETCEIEDGMLSTDLRKHYVGWLREQGEDFKVNPQKFGSDLREKFGVRFRQERARQVRYSVRLTTEARTINHPFN